MDYHIIHKLRLDGRRGGGVAIVLNKEVKLITFSTLTSNCNCDILMATLSLNKTTITIITIYRPPNFEYITFYSDFSDIIHTYSLHNNLIVLGDFNFYFDSNFKPTLTFYTTLQ